jgi:hypothetical protein
MVTVATQKTKMGQPPGRKIITGELQADKKNSEHSKTSSTALRSGAAGRAVVRTAKGRFFGVHG